MSLLLLRRRQLVFLFLLLVSTTITTTKSQQGGCQVDFTVGVEIHFNETTQVDICTIVLHDIAIDQQPYACVVEKFAGNATEYGPLALLSTTTTTLDSMMAVSDRGVGQTGAFTPDVYPFEGSILSFQYIVYPALSETLCGGSSDELQEEDVMISACNATTTLDVDVFGCFVQDATPSPTPPPATPRPSPPPFVMTIPDTTTITTMTPSSSGGGGVMATRTPTIMPADMPTDAPATKSVMAVVTKDPFKPPVSPSPTIQPINNNGPTPPSFVPPDSADAIVQGSAASSSTRTTTAAALSWSILVVLVAVAAAGRL